MLDGLRVGALALNLREIGLPKSLAHRNLVSTLDNA
jgi:hypothetical protein